MIPLGGLAPLARPVHHHGLEGPDRSRCGGRREPQRRHTCGRFALGMRHGREAKRAQPRVSPPADLVAEAAVPMEECPPPFSQPRRGTKCAAISRSCRYHGRSLMVPDFSRRTQSSHSLPRPSARGAAEACAVCARRLADIRARRAASGGARTEASPPLGCTRENSGGAVKVQRRCSRGAVEVQRRCSGGAGEVSTCTKV